MRSRAFLSRKAWPWLASAVILSSLGWLVLPLLPFHTSDQAEGSWYLAALAGIVSTATTASTTMLYLTVVQQSARIGLAMYIIVILVVSLPALAFQSIVISASMMPAFLGNWVMSGDTTAPQAWLALSFAFLYLIIAVVTYPFARRGGAAAGLAATGVGAAIVGAVVVRVFGH